MNAVDTNVLIYACDNAAGAKQQRALELIHGLTEPVLIWQVACEFIASSRRLAPDRLTAAEAWQRLATFVKLMPLALPSAAVLVRARQLHLNRQCSYWDAMIYGACVEAGVTRIYSEDLPGALVSELEVVNPFSVPHRH